MKRLLKKYYRQCFRLLAAIAGRPLVVTDVAWIHPEGAATTPGIIPQQSFYRKPPFHTDAALHWKFAPGAPGTTTQGAHVAGELMQQVKVLGPDGTIINKHNQLVYDASGEICIVLETHSVFNRIIFSKPKQLSGRGLNLSASQGEKNYFHWICDALPKLELARRMGYKDADFDYFIVNSRARAFQQETLQLLGIPDHKIIALDEHPYLLCEELLVTTATSDSGNVSPWIIDFLRRSFIPGDANDQGLPDKLFICRKHAIWRRLLNETEVKDFLEARGFAAVYLEELSFAEQVALFHNASVIVATHGAGLTNVAFCKPGARIVELFPPTYINQGYWTMASVTGLEYAYLIGEGITIPGNDDLLRNSDFSISLSRLEPYLAPLPAVAST